MPSPAPSIPPPSAGPAPRGGRARRLAAWVLAAGVLALVFAGYRQPDFVVALATRAWSCF